MSQGEDGVGEAEEWVGRYTSVRSAFAAHLCNMKASEGRLSMSTAEGSTGAGDFRTSDIQT